MSFKTAFILALALKAHISVSLAPEYILVNHSHLEHTTSYLIHRITSFSKSSIQFLVHTLKFLNSLLHFWTFVLYIIFQILTLPVHSTLHQVFLLVPYQIKFFSTLSQVYRQTNNYFNYMELLNSKKKT